MHRLEAFNTLVREPRLIRRSEFLAKDCPVPRRDGIYAWFFDDVIEGLDTSPCYRLNGRPLLYVGIARKKDQGSERKRNMHHRIREHFARNAEASTLRLSLGSLLGIELREVGGHKSGDRRWVFANGGEARLDQWMEQHAYLAWMPIEQPWEVEPMVFNSGLHLPINIEHHQGRGCYVSRIRDMAKDKARALPWISSDSGRS